MQDTATKNIYSLNLIAYMRLHNISYKICNDNNLFFAIVNDGYELQQAIDQYKNDTGLQSFLHSFAELRDEINSIRNGK